MQTILGSSGTIGTLLAGELSKYTDKVRLVSRSPRRINNSDELMSVDLTLPGAVDRAVMGSEVVYLTVGFDYNTKVWENQWPALMRNTIDACIKYNARLVFFDNVYCYDENEIPHMTEESKINPPSRKGEIRRELNEMLLSSIREGTLNALIARSADFYGTDSRGSIPYQLIVRNLAAGKSASWFIRSDAQHSFTYVYDAARACAILGNTHDAFGQVWHLPTDSSKITIAEFTDMVADELKEKSHIRIIPLFIIRMMSLFNPLMKELSEMMYQYDRDYFFDSSKFIKKFGFRPTSYRDGIREMCRSHVPVAKRPAA
jgi:nucleoside-diphosphate-sugar epimerase